MKVLKPGKWNDPWKVELTCTKCEAILEVEEGDLLPIWVNGSYCESGDPAIGYTCGVCGKINAVPSKMIYERVRNEVEKKRRS